MPPPTDADLPALALILMGELQRYRAQGGPLGPVVQRFVSELGAAQDTGIAPDVVQRLARLARERDLDEGDQRWIRSQLPEIVRRIVLPGPAPAANRSSPPQDARR